MTTRGPTSRIQSVKTKQKESDLVLDEIIERIDASLPEVHRLATEVDQLRKLKCERTKKAFRDLQESPILNDAKDDICFEADGASHINGKHQ